MNRLMHRVAVTLVLLLAGISGCAEAGGEPLVDQDRAAELDQVLWDRTEEIVAACMQGQGFDYVTEAYPGRERLVFAAQPFDLTEEEALARGFGLVDDVVESLGAAVPTADADPAPDEELPEALQGARDTALHGSPEALRSGCRGQADGQARTELAADLAAVHTRVADVGQRIETDPRYAVLWDEWSSCMSEEGIAATTLESLQMELAGASNELVPAVSFDETEDVPATPTFDRAAADALRAQEIAAATATVRCLRPLRTTFDTIVNDAQRSLG